MTNNQTIYDFLIACSYRSQSAERVVNDLPEEASRFTTNILEGSIKGEAYTPENLKAFFLKCRPSVLGDFISYLPKFFAEEGDNIGSLRNALQAAINSQAAKESRGMSSEPFAA